MTDISLAIMLGEKGEQRRGGDGVKNALALGCGGCFYRACDRVMNGKRRDIKFVP